jgi:pyruvate/2-oxoglutarate dehydrogenase complex dihydrolipoamide acyltransferase (E2) component
MKTHQLNDQVVPYSKLRRVMAITLRSAQRKPMIHGLIEVDVTRAREYLREHKANTGESLSFTAFIITCVAQAVDENKSLHACRKGSRHLILFDDVDVATAIERDMAGQKQPIVYIVRAANKKTFREIHHEIRAAQVEAVEKAWVSFRDFHFLSVVVFRFIWPIFWWMLGRYPQVQKRYGGTVGLTAVGMFGKGAGWGIPVEYRALNITLGGLAEKPGVVDGQIAIREYLCMTLSFNHNLIDGAPAARFTERLKDLVESGYGLVESEVNGHVDALSTAHQPLGSSED